MYRRQLAESSLCLRLQRGQELRAAKRQVAGQAGVGLKVRLALQYVAQPEIVPRRFIQLREVCQGFADPR